MIERIERNGADILIYRLPMRTVWPSLAFAGGTRVAGDRDAEEDRMA